MNSSLEYNRCLSFIHSQVSPNAAPLVGHPLLHPQPTITISRLTGAGGHAIAAKLATLLRERAPGLRPWMVFDQNLVEKVLEEHNLPKELACFMPEDRRSELNDIVEELLGLHPPSWTLIRQTTETILHLAELGNAILVGRAGNVITAKLDNTFHIRLVASLESRVARIQSLTNLDVKTATHMVQQEDEGRARYVKKYFNQEAGNPMLYHLVINTDLVSLDETAQLVCQAVIRHGNLRNPRAAAAPPADVDPVPVW